MHVNHPFELHIPEYVVEASERKAGEGCYISTTIHNRRYYGVLIDQAALKAASLLHFRNEAAGLELNRKIEQLKLKKLGQEQSAEDRKRRPDPDESDNPDGKRIRLEDGPVKIQSEMHAQERGRPIQKFLYMDSVSANGKTPATPGYRILLATYADAVVAADGDPEKARFIEEVCQAGGDYVGAQHYYQYEVRVGETAICNPVQMYRLTGLEIGKICKSSALRS